MKAHTIKIEAAMNMRRSSELANQPRTTEATTNPWHKD